MIPFLLSRKGKSDQMKSKIRSYQLIAIRLFRSYIIVTLIILSVNLLYYYLYKTLGGKIPQSGFSTEVMIQALVLTAVAAMLYLYLMDNTKNGKSIFFMLTIIIAYSTFLASLPSPEGQPIYDETLWLNIPIAIFSGVGELFGIPYFFKNRVKKDELIGYSK